MRIHKYLKFAILALLAGCAASDISKKDIPQSYRDIKFPEFEYVAPYPGDYRFEIADSITLYAVRDSSLPLVDLTFYFRESVVPKDRGEAAALQLLSSLYARGGTEKLSPAAVDDSLEFLSASISGSIGSAQSVIHLNCLSRDFGKVLPMLFELFNAPRLDSARLELQKHAAIQRYSHRHDQPGAHASALSARVMYKNNPKLWIADSAHLARVARASLLSLKGKVFVPRRVVVAAAGDFNADSLRNAIAGLFAAWKPVSSKREEFPPLEFNEHKGIFTSEKDISQANIIMAAPFIKRPHPDYYGAAIANYILGGSSFSSRLTNRVRAQAGLAYSIYSFAQSSYDDIALSGVALQTKAESAAVALQMVREECIRFGAEGPTEQELSFAKKAIVESMPGMFENAEATANTFAVSELNGRSLEHFREYPQKIMAVTAEQVKAMAAKYFSPDSLRVSVVGAGSKMLLEGAAAVSADSLDFF